MTREALLLLSPPGLFLLGAVLCLLFEAAGTPVGARKRGPRTHIALLALGTCGAVLLQVVGTLGDALTPAAAFGGALVLDLIGQLAIAAVALLVALAIGAGVPGLRELDAEHGDEYALLLMVGAGASVLVVAGELLVVAGALSLVLAAFTALCALDREAAQGAEAAVKLVKLGGIVLALISFAAALRYGATGDTALCLRGDAAPDGLAWLGAALVLIVVLGQLAAAPLHLTRVDVVQGAPPFIGGLAAAVGLLSGGVLLLRAIGGCSGALPEIATPILTAVALLTLIVPPIAALDQVRVPRVAAHLVGAQAGPVLVAVLAYVEGGAAGPIVLALGAGILAGSAAVFALAFLERGGEEGSTWERWSGAGRENPLFCLALLWLWASLAGVPGTAGFAARVVVAQEAFGVGADLLGLVVVVAPAAAAAPVLRLAIFLFAKVPDRELDPQVSGWRGVVLAAACVLVLALGLFPTPLLDLSALGPLVFGGPIMSP